MIYSINQSINDLFSVNEITCPGSTTGKFRIKEVERRNEHEARREAEPPTAPLPLCVDYELTDKVYSRSLEI